MREVQLKVMKGAKTRSIYWFWHESADIIVVSRVLIRFLRKIIFSNARNRELQDFLLAFMRPCKEETLFLASNMLSKFSITKFWHDLHSVRDNKRTGIFTLCVIYVDHKISHFTTNEKIFTNCDLHVSILRIHQSYFFWERYLKIEDWIVHNWSYRAYMDTLTIANLTFTIWIIDKICFFWYDLCLEEPT